MNARNDSNASFIVFSDDWGEHMSSCQHIFNVISRDSKVLWINTIGMRAPRLSLTDLRKVWRKGRKMLGGGRSRQTREQSRNNIVVRQPVMLPYSNLSAVRKFNAASVAKAVRAAASDLGFVEPCIVTTVPNAADYLSAIDGRRVVYYCVDDFADWPGHQRDLVRGMEQRLIARADALVATSRKLYDRLSASGKPTSLLTHGVDMDLFSRVVSEEHPCLANIPKPRAGYFGLIDERSDQNLIAAVASRVPEYSFVFAGPVETSVASLEAVRNVHFTGPLAYRDLPSFIAGMNALLIPYVVNDFADSLSPLKLKEYYATGKPIISTPIADVRGWEDEIGIGRTAEEWATLLAASEATDLDGRRQHAARRLVGETWADKAAELLRVCAGSDETDDARADSGNVA